jgi:hypothetical protein
MRTGGAAFVKAEVNYAAALVEAGLDGIAAAWKKRELKFPPAISPAIWAPAAAGTAAGILGACLRVDRQRPASRMAAFGLAGSAFGLGLGLAWISRDFTRGAARGAIRKINDVRDARWLERNPIAYA